MFVIIHSGQTGVERGAHEAAITCGLQVAGFMSADGRDELGHVPDDVAQHLTVGLERGPRTAVRANLEIASGVIFVVPSLSLAERVPGFAWVLQATRAKKLPFVICDVSTNLDDTASWARRIAATAGSRRIMVTGPRETRWPDGHANARRIVTALGILAPEE